MGHIYRCSTCKEYTMQGLCCEKPTSSVKPAKFSVEDRHADYTRKAKESERKEKGLL